MNLAATQEFFWSVIAEGKPVSHHAVEKLLVGTPGLPAVARFEIYAAMYINRLTEALALEFPLLAALLGEECFFAVAEAYVRACPSTHPSIDHIGCVLPAFLTTVRRRALAKRFPILARPDLTELATLERTRSVVFDAADDVAVGTEALRSIPAERLPHAVLTPINALAVIKARHAVVDLAAAIEDESAPPDAHRKTELIVVYRQREAVYHRAVPANEGRALILLFQEKPLAHLCSVFAHERDPTGAAFGVIGSWIGHGFIRSVTLPQP